MLTALQPLENNIALWFQSIHNPFLNVLMPIISFISDNGYIWIPVIVLMLIFRRTRRIGYCMVAGFIICAALGLGLKYMIARPRPTDLFPDIPLLIERPDAYASFPSGHSIMSFCMAFILWFQTWKFGLPATVFACLVGFSRLYLFAHFPTDVLASIVIAAAVALLCVLVCYLVFRDKGGLRALPKDKKAASTSGKHYH